MLSYLLNNILQKCIKDSHCTVISWGNKIHDTSKWDWDHVIFLQRQQHLIVVASSWRKKKINEVWDVLCAIVVDGDMKTLGKKVELFVLNINAVRAISVLYLKILRWWKRATPPPLPPKTYVVSLILFKSVLNHRWS